MAEVITPPVVADPIDTFGSRVRLSSERLLTLGNLRSVCMTGQTHCTSRWSRSVRVLNTCTVFSDFKRLETMMPKKYWGLGPKWTGIPTGGVEFTILLAS